MFFLKSLLCLLYFIKFFSYSSYKWEAIDQDSKVSYTFKLCESSPSTSCDTNTAVCAENLNNKTKQSVGEYSTLVFTQ